MRDIPAAGAVTTGGASEPVNDLTAWRQAVDRRLELLTRYGPGAAAPLTDSVRHSALAPGKRLRPLLFMAAFAEYDAAPEAVLDPACAVEMVHAASLILDDLPSMDDASLRRGRPANHAAFSESTAILAAVSLLAQAFGVIARAPVGTEKARNDLIAALSDAIGVAGLCGGQYEDLNRQGRSGQGALEMIHAQKTGALFAVAAAGGAMLVGAEEETINGLHRFGLSIGLTFQAFDDVLDAVGSPCHTGKNVGQDRRLGALSDPVTLKTARGTILNHLEAAETELGAVARDRGPLHLYTSHLREALDRHLSLCECR